jgi:hypothetical protein
MYLADLRAIGVTSLFHCLCGGCLLAATPVGPQLRKRETGKSGNFPCTINKLLVGFHDSVQAEYNTVPICDMHPPLLGEQFHFFSADPGQIISKISFDFDVSHVICGKII